MIKHAPTKLMLRVQKQEHALRLIGEGYSFSQAADELGLSVPTVSAWAKQAGVKSPAGNRFSDFSHRRPLAKKVRAAGGTWQEVADAFATVEGFEVSGFAARAWVVNNAPDIFNAGKGKRPAFIRRAIIAAHGLGASV